MLSFFFQAEDGIRDVAVTGVQTCALPILHALLAAARAHPHLQHEPIRVNALQRAVGGGRCEPVGQDRSEEHTSELQSRLHLVCRLLLEKKKKHKNTTRLKVTNTHREQVT